MKILGKIEDKQTTELYESQHVFDQHITTLKSVTKPETTRNRCKTLTKEDQFVNKKSARASCFKSLIFY